MEQQIQDLIASIKKDGIESATNESKVILEEARKEAERIVEEAKKERDKLLSEAKKAIEIERESSISSVKQAARDVSLTLKKGLEERFQKILAQKVTASLSDEVLAQAIVAVVKGEGSGCVVEVGSDRVNAINALLAKELEKELKDGIILKSSSAVGSGFKVYSKDGSAYIDLSDSEITKLLYPYLSPSLKDYLRS